MPVYPAQLYPCGRNAPSDAGEEEETRRQDLPDFLIGAHALEHARDRLLAWDRGFLRDYFTDLALWDSSRSSAVRARAGRGARAHPGPSTGGTFSRFGTYMIAEVPAMLRRVLFACGLAAPLLRLAVVLGGALRPGYSHLSMPISQLIESGAPNKLPAGHPVHRLQCPAPGFCLGGRDEHAQRGLAPADRREHHSRGGGRPWRSS